MTALPQLAALIRPGVSEADAASDVTAVPEQSAPPLSRPLRRCWQSLDYPTSAKTGATPHMRGIS